MYPYYACTCSNDLPKYYNYMLNYLVGWRIQGGRCICPTLPQKFSFLVKLLFSPVFLNCTVDIIFILNKIILAPPEFNNHFSQNFLVPIQSSLKAVRFASTQVKLMVYFVCSDATRKAGHSRAEKIEVKLILTFELNRPYF